jgi:hypothetical protein
MIMSDHLIKAVDELEAKLAEQESAASKTRVSINILLEMMGQPAKYADTGTSAAPSQKRDISASIKPDQFFNKPTATCVRTALELLKAAGRAPASTEAIYEILVKGGYEFGSKSKDVQMAGLNVSIGKNSALFVKLPNGLIGLKEWYGMAQRKSKNSKSDETVSEDESSQETAPSENADDLIGSISEVAEGEA